MCVCIYTCVYIYIYIFMFICIYVHMKQRHMNNPSPNFEPTARYPISGYSHIKNCGHVRDMVDF